MPTPLILYRGFPVTPSFTWSPFVTKLELRLRLGGQAYTLAQGSPLSAPRGKIPYVNIAPLSPPSPSPSPSSSSSTPAASSPPPPPPLQESNLFGDSSLITTHLISTSHLPPLNNTLTAAQQLTDTAIRALCEDKLYFAALRERWLAPANYCVQRDTVMGGIPWPVRVVVGAFAARRIAYGLDVQGMGRFSDAEVARIREDAWGVIAAALGVARDEAADEERPFWVLGGNEATEADCTVFGFLVSGLVAASAPDSEATIRAHEVLLDYVRRIQRVYFHDYEAVV